MLNADDLAIIGICCDHNSSFMRGPARAPAAIRATLHNGAANLAAETGPTLAANPRVVDLGDIDVDENDAAFLAIEDPIRDIVSADARPLVLGGDHAVTYPVLRAVAAHHGPVDLLHFDAHADLYDEFEGNRLSHACPFARIMEEGLVRRLVQVGIRTQNDQLRAQVERFGVEVHEMRDTERPADLRLVFSRPLYISFDLDALDPAFAPGVSHHEPGGLSARDAIAIIQRLDGRVIGGDIVEYNPTRDLHDMTAMVAAKLVKEIGGRILADNPEA